MTEFYEVIYSTMANNTVQHKATLEISELPNVELHLKSSTRRAHSRKWTEGARAIPLGYMRAKCSWIWIYTTSPGSATSLVAKAHQTADIWYRSLEHPTRKK